MKRLVTAVVSLIILLCGCTTTHSQLRVGMTGDYPPITSYDPKTNSFLGSAVDMAEQLGKYLGVTICFVKTSWPTLTNDLKRGKFDIAMGGVSATSERARDFLLSKWKGKNHAA